VLAASATGVQPSLFGTLTSARNEIQVFTTLIERLTTDAYTGVHLWSDEHSQQPWNPRKHDFKKNQRRQNLHPLDMAPARCDHHRGHPLSCGVDVGSKRTQKVHKARFAVQSRDAQGR
jgi:hypothetical protein